ncbi:MAG: hypothetical protein V4556_07415 [Bacteroidota bacterium]
MGLDIHISTDKDKEVYSIDFYENEKDLRYKMSLSREFCNLMCRQHVSTGTPEFDQIAQLVNIDIAPILEMEKYWDEESTEQQIFLGETEEERQKIASKIQSERDSLKGNIDRVLQTINNLIDKLSGIEMLNKKIKVYGNDTIGIDYYFSNFEVDKGEGYIRNNFGQDLRNFQRFLKYAKSKGAATVYFNYG